PSAGTRRTSRPPSGPSGATIVPESCDTDIGFNSKSTPVRSSPEPNVKVCACEEDDAFGKNVVRYASHLPFVGAGGISRDPGAAVCRIHSPKRMPFDDEVPLVSAPMFASSVLGSAPGPFAEIRLWNMAGSSACGAPAIGVVADVCAI